MKKNINGKQLGELLELKKSPLTDWKNGKAKPTVEQVKRMCEIFATTADYLILGKEEKQLTENESEMLHYFKKLPNREQIKFIGKIEDVAKGYEENGNSSISKTG